MSSFLKVAFKNLIKGPSTEKYPFGEAPAPEKLRGKIHHDPKACMACGMCQHVCAGGAIRLVEAEDKSGMNFIVWHDTCCFCGMCAYYCPTGAIKLTNDYHTAHLQEDKYKYVEKTFIEYARCECCGKHMVPIAPEIIEKVYGKEGDTIGVTKLCEDCRRKLTAKRGAFK